MTFPGGTHDMWIRYWLAAGGIDPDKDVSTIVVPPPQMVANMKVGNMDGLLRRRAVERPARATRTSATPPAPPARSGRIIPRKSLGMRADWVDKNPKAAMAVLMAVMEAQQWCEKMENKDELANIIGKRQWFNVPPADIINRIKGDIDYGDGRKVNGSDLLDEVLEAAASPIPTRAMSCGSSPRTSAGASCRPISTPRRSSARSTARTCGATAAKNIGAADADIPKTTSRGKETFFDGKVFDPDGSRRPISPRLQIKKVA